jgi:D-glycero-D-manno-heptose 1,7-bisphosphate phosphatase
MLLAARDAFGLDLAESLLVGDQPTDVEAAARAGVGRAALLAPPGRAVVLPPGARRVARLAELHALLAPGTSWNAPST